MTRSERGLSTPTRLVVRPKGTSRCLPTSFANFSELRRWLRVYSSLEWSDSGEGSIEIQAPGDLLILEVRASTTTAILTL
jgi:hypothetical protein